MKLHYRMAFMVLALAWLLGQCVAAQAVPPDCVVLDITGDVQARSASEKNWTKLDKDRLIKTDDLLLTGPKSKCMLGFGAQTVQIKEEALVQIKSLDPVRLFLQSGRIYSLVRKLKPGSTFEVRTPVATAAARGTGWGQTPNTVDCFDGTVGIEGMNGQSGSVSEGNGIDIGDDGSLGQPHGLSDEAMQGWNQFTQEAGDGSGGSQGDGSSEGFGDDDESGNDGQELSDLKEGSREAQDKDRVQDELDKDKGKGKGGYPPGY